MADGRFKLRGICSLSTFRHFSLYVLFFFIVLFQVSNAKKKEEEEGNNNNEIVFSFEFFGVVCLLKETQL